MIDEIKSAINHARSKDEMENFVSAIRTVHRFFSHGGESLGGAATAIEIAEMGGDFDLKLVKRSVFNAVNTLERLIKFADPKTRNIEVKTISIDDLAKCVVEDSTYNASIKNNDILVSKNKSSATLAWDGLAIIAIEELVTNACKYSPSEEPVLLSFYRKKDSLKISVINTNIPNKHFDPERFMRPFVTGTNVIDERYVDTFPMGCGLPIVNSIVLNMGGYFVIYPGMNELVGKESVIAEITLPLVGEQDD